MSQVETSVGSTVLSVVEGIVERNDYNYYYVFSTSPTDSYLIQSDSYNINTGTFSDCLVTEFHFVHDDNDHLSDWRMWSYAVDVYYVNNPENYIVFTNALSGYPVLRGDVRYASQYYFAGLCMLCTVVASAILFFRIWRINHG